MLKRQRKLDMGGNLKHSTKRKKKRKKKEQKKRIELKLLGGEHLNRH